jgi:hypothetical protein
MEGSIVDGESLPEAINLSEFSSNPFYSIHSTFFKNCQPGETPGGPLHADRPKFKVSTSSPGRGPQKFVLPLPI